jgi:transposase
VQKGEPAMKKNNTCPKSPKRSKNRQRSITIGMDLGDKTSHYCVLDSEDEMKREGTVATTKKGMKQRFGSLPKCRIAIEVGTHSPWVSRLLSSFGHEVIVANARQVKLISASSRKDDRLDAQTLARLARMDPELLRPIRHRGEKAQADLMQVRVRAALVDTRTSLVNTARGLAKAMGERLPKCDADQMGVEKMQGLPAVLVEALRPLLETVESLTKQIKASDQKLEQLAGRDYPETELLRQVSGVGSLISLTFVLTVEDPNRFGKSRDVGCYVGLRPKRSESGQSRPQLGISKEGDVYLRKLLVQGAHCILSQKSPDTDLKRWGLKLAGKGNKNAKKRALVAVARKLAILLHHLWVNGEVYEPLRNSRQLEQTAVA